MSIPRNQVRLTAEAVGLQWANGRTQARAAGVGRFGAFVGFHIEAMRDPELDRLLDSLSLERLEIKHQRQGAQPVIVPHWGLGETVKFYPVTSGPVAPTVAGSLANGNARETAAAGIGLRWGQGERSKLAIRGYVDLLGPDTLVQLSVRSRMTDELLKALVDHVRVCEAADGLVDRARHPEPVTLHEIALPLGPGAEAEWGKGDTTTVTPLAGLHPSVIDAAYLRTVWRPDGIHAAALSAWEGIQHWAKEYASGGEHSQDEEDR
jgi:hypothetical protein